MKQILITGGAGFIGSHLAKALSKENDVICLDNLFTGDKHRLDGLNVEFIRHDIIEPILLEVEEIYHLACPASPIHYQYNPVKTIKTSIMGTINMLGLARRTKSKFLLTSTSEVYGDPKEHPQTESYWGNVNPVGIRSCYDESKRVAETLTMDYHRQNHVNTRIARLFNTFGPNMSINDGRVISNFIVQALKGEPITIYGDGSQTRSFCYVDDLVDGLIKLMASNLTEPINLGNPEERTILEIAQIIIRLTESKSPTVLKPLPSDDPTKRQPNITKAKTLLNWEPTISKNFETCLLKTIDYFKKLI
jgi:UDP-glucuronate decarboxylase